MLGLLAIVTVGLGAVSLWMYRGEADPGTAYSGLSPIVFVLPIVLLGLFALGLFAARKPRPRRDPAISQRVSHEAPASKAPSPGPASGLETQADTPDVFVSYSHQNAETVIPIVETVEEQGLSIWIDREEMRAGQNWAGQIVRAIKASGRFCLMCSAQSFASDHVRREVYLADKYGKDMVPVLLDGAEMPEDIEYFMAGRQWLDLTALPDADRATAIRNALAGASA